MKNILFISGTLGSGGAERQIVNISSLLSDKGYNVDIICYGKDDFYSYLFKDKNISITTITTSTKIKLVYEIKRYIKKNKIDIVISFLDIPNFINVILSFYCKNYRVVTGVRSATSFLSFRKKMFSHFQKYSDVIVFNSKNSRGIWEEKYTKTSNILRTIYNTINLPRLDSKYIPRENGITHIIVAASYQYLKNPIGLITAVSLLNKDEKRKVRIDWYGRKEVTLGNTKVFDESMELISKYNLNSVIYLHDETKDIINKMNKADLVALFSRVEGLPNAICEGMMLGKPIIMTKVSDYNILVDKSNGFICEWNKISTIKDVLIKAINLSPNQLSNMGIQSKVKAQVLFSENQIIKKWIDIIEL